MKIYDWRRFLTFLALLLLFIILILSQCTKKELQVKEIQEHSVQSGETLWSIATEYRPQTMSIQEYIYNLEQYNNINAQIFPHQKIQILIYEEV
mgnify:CR=1 FL=1